MDRDNRPHRTNHEIHQDHMHITLRADGSPDSPDMRHNAYGAEMPRDPARSERASGARPATAAWPDPHGNRAERRAAGKVGRKRIYGGKGGTHRAGKHRRR